MGHQVTLAKKSFLGDSALQALSSDLNGRLRAAGQKIFTATTVMEPLEKKTDKLRGF